MLGLLAFVSLRGDQLRRIVRPYYLPRVLLRIRPYLCVFFRNPVTNEFAYDKASSLMASSEP